MVHMPLEMNVFETILARRSVRDYLDKGVDMATIRVLLEAAVRAPSAADEELWAFVIVQDKLLLKRISDQARPLLIQEMQSQGFKHFGNVTQLVTTPDFDVFHGAGTLILVCARTASGFAAADCWLAAENLMLAACAMGLGSCVVGFSLPALNHPDIKSSLGIPPDYSAVAPIIVGYPGGETCQNVRKAPYILSFLSP